PHLPQPEIGTAAASHSRAVDNTTFIANNRAQFSNQLTTLSKKASVLSPNVAAITFYSPQPWMPRHSNCAQIIIEHRKQITRLMIEIIEINDRAPFLPRPARLCAAFQTRAEQKQLDRRRPRTGLHERFRQIRWPYRHSKVSFSWFSRRRSRIFFKIWT